MAANGHDLAGKEISGDETIRRVIAAEARAQEAQRTVAALRKDRDELLGEFTDYRNARQPLPPKRVSRKPHRAEMLRVSAGDLHGQRMDRAAVAAFLHDLRSLDPDEIVLGGDMGECGGWLAKHQPIGYVAESDYSYQEDMLAANWFLDQVAEAAPRARVVMLEGNHEDRVERWCVDQTRAHQRDAEFLRAAFSPATMLRLEDRGIQYYRRSVEHVPGLPPGWIKLGKMFFAHELGSGKNAARDAVLKTAGNVTYFHTHREDTATVVFPGVGVCKAFCPGCLCVRQPMWRHSDPTSWSHGYAIDCVAASGLFQRVHVPIWEGESLGAAMIHRLRA